MFKKIGLLLLSISINYAFAQNVWTTKQLFEHKNFIENKGQFDAKKLPNKEAVRFTANIDGVEFCFTNSGYTIVKKVDVKRTEKELAQVKKEHGILPEDKSEDKEFKFKKAELFHELRFIDANADVIIIAENQLSNYYSYANIKNGQSKETIIANAFTKLTYRNIYPFTDVVFEFPKNSSGIKYSIYLHPGADAENIKMLLPENAKAKIIKHNIEINSGIGKI